MPKQEGGVECGVFLLHFMRCLSDGLDEHKQVEKLRVDFIAFYFIFYSTEIN